MPKASSDHGNNHIFAINYEVIQEAPPGAPYIIFHHASANDLHDWHNLNYVSAFSSHFNLILIDLLGHGQSDKPTEAAQYEPTLRAQDTIAVLNDLNMHEPVIFFGGSLGGRIGFTLACDPHFTTRFSAFIILGATPYGTSKLGTQFATWFQQGLPCFVSQVEEAMNENYPLSIRNVVLANNADAMVAANSLPWPDYSASLAQISQPVLLIAGEHDPVKPDMERCTTLLSDCKLEILFGKNHARSYWDCAGKIFNLAKPFLVEKKLYVK